MVVKAVFLDRDGVINVDNGYISKKKDFIFHKNVFKSLAELQEAGYILIVITNQSGIGRGFFSEEDYNNVTHYMLEELKIRGIFIKNVYHCPHRPEDKCDCRKPNTKMIEKATAFHNINLESSILLGDKASDMQAGKKIGINKCYLIGKKDTSVICDGFFNSLSDFVNSKIY